METTRISKRAVDGLQPGGKDTFLWDAELGGFGMRCRVSGAKFYILKYRHLGRQRWLTIGRHGSPWTPELARREAKRLLGEIAAGRDPAQIRDSGKAAPTVNELIDLFLADHVEVKRKPRTAAEYRRLFDKLIRSALGQHRLEAVTRTEIARMHHKMRSTPYQANRVLAVVSKLFNWAERYGYRPDGTNPVGMSRNLGRKSVNDFCRVPKWRASAPCSLTSSETARKCQAPSRPSGS